MSILFNERHSIKSQLGVAFLLIVTMSFGVCIAISLGLTSVLGTSAYSTAEDGIAKQAYSNAATASNELAAAISKDLAAVAESVCMVGALQAAILTEQIRNEGGTYVLPFRTFDSFREFDFQPGCEYPSCPVDFGDLSHRSRIANWNGSTEHSSVYLYQSEGTAGGRPAGAVRNDSAWINLLAQNQYLQPVIDSLSYQDAAFAHLYNRGYNTTVFFYLSVQVGDENSPDGYLSVHRGFPGTERNSTTYDPPKRSWFRHAPVDAFYLDGPYKETFTGKYVVNLSSRKVLDPPSGGLVLPQPSVVVAASVMLLDSLAQIIHTRVYPNEGFGVLIKRATQEVLVWHNTSQAIYNETSGHFLTLAQLEPALAGVDVRTQRSFAYTDAAGVRWLVASSPCLVHTDHATGDTSPALMMLVFSQWDAATASLPALQDNIHSTTGQIYQLTGVLTATVFTLLVVTVCAFVVWLTEPLAKIHHILAQIIAIAAEDEAKRDYSEIVAVSWFDLHRSDELGYLATSFWYMVTMLHNANEARKSRPKYPANPFHVPVELWMPSTGVPQEHGSDTTGALHKSAAAGSPQVPTTAATTTTTSSSSALLGSLFLFPTRESLVTPAAFLDRLNRHQATHRSESAATQRCTAPVAAEVSTVAAVVPAAADGDVLGQLSAELTSASTLAAMEMGLVGAPASASALAAGSTRYAAVQPVEAEAAPAARVRTCQVFTLKVYLYALSALLLVDLVLVMAVAVYLLQAEGQGWMTETGDSIETAEVLNMQTITLTKADFVKTYFKQVTIDTQVLASAFTGLLDGNLTSTFDPVATYLPSYSLDPTNYYSYPLPRPSAKNGNFSGYFDVASVNCITSGSCAPYQNSDLTRLTSLVDLQLRPYFHAGNILDFVQTGHEDVGYTRVLPYSYKSYGNPASCLIEDRSLPMCEALFQSSPCNPAVTAGAFPAYDSRCRNWYRRTLEAGTSTEEVRFEYPRVSSGGSLVVTAVSPVRRHHSASGALYGALNVNVLAATLSASVNQFKILKSGYVYLVDAKNVSRVVLHPRLTATCTSLRCCEDGLSPEEYTQFVNDVLIPLQRETPLQGAKSVDVSAFQKGGESWRFAHASVTYGTVDYILLAVVPRSEIMKASIDVEDQINASNVAILAAASCSLFVFTCIIFFVTQRLVQGIAEPVNDLSHLCDQVIDGNLHGDGIPTKASSSDMRVLLTAFTNTMTALRFGSDSYAKGDVKLAQDMFQDALQLYTTTHQLKGIGACHNNLGAVCMSLNQPNEALVHYSKAIDIAEKVLAGVSDDTSTSAPAPIPVTVVNMPPPGGAAPAVEMVRVSPAPCTTPQADQAALQLRSKARAHAQRVLSDRRGNLALLHIAQQQYAEAFACLEQCMEQDKRSGYIRGCVVKQGNMGHLYLKQGEVQSAERVFRSALTFVTIADTRLFSETWDETETLLARQIALFNMAQLQEHLKQRAQAVHYYLLSLSQGRVLHVTTATQTLARLQALLLDEDSISARMAARTVDTYAGSALVAELMALAHQHNLTPQDVDGSAATSFASKRVAFALDFSGSMGGGKIQAAVQNLNDLFASQLAPQDELLILTFHHTCSVVLPLTKKEHNESRISQLISTLVRPGGGTALYDAIKSAVLQLSPQGSARATAASTRGGSDWVVVLTDGQEGASQIKKPEVESILRSAACGFVMIGVGADVDDEELRGLVRCAKRGFYVSASGDQEGICKAFGRVATLIQGQVIMEDL